jgi:uncharacterized membrane protein YidH (DUF202 family)
MPDMRRVEALWTKIIGVLLILIGVVLLASPEIAYTSQERIAHTRYSVKRERTLIVPRPAAVLVIGAGVTTLIIAIRRSTAG